MVLQDRFGSKSILIVCFLLMAIPGFISMVFVNGLVAKVVGMIGLWIYNDTSFVLTGVFFNELLVDPYRRVSNAASRIVYCLGAIFGTVITYYLQDYKQITVLHF